DVVVDDTDKNNVTINFDFQGTFDNSPPGGEVMSDTENGLVRRWFNAWNVTFHAETYKYPEMKVYATYDGGEGPGGPPGGSGQCTWTIGSPSQGTVMSQSDMDPGANGVIRADNRDAEKFDVLQGIPTSESLYTNAFADNYLYKQEWAQMSGQT